MRVAEPSPDPFDLFSDSLLSLFDYVSPSQGAPLELYTYTPPTGARDKRALHVLIPPQTVNSLFAHHVWNASVLMADSIALGQLDVRGRRVLELGAGTGIPGLLCAREGAEQVVLSDFDDAELVKNLQANIVRGLPDQSELQAKVHVAGHSWGDSCDKLQQLSPTGTYNTILLADCIWSSSAHTLLLTSLTTLLSPTDPKAFIYLVSGFHSGRAGVRAFLRKAFEAGFEYEGAWEEVGFGREGEEREVRRWGWDLGEGDVEPEVEVEGEEKRNRWVVQGRLRWGRDG